MSKEIEIKAAAAHNMWAHWMNYLFTKCTEHQIKSKNAHTGQMEFIKTGNLVISEANVIKWKKQARTAYLELSPEEQLSDIAVAKLFLKEL